MLAHGCLLRHAGCWLDFTPCANWQWPIPCASKTFDNTPEADLDDLGKANHKFGSDAVSVLPTAWYQGSRCDCIHKASPVHRSVLRSWRS